MPRSPVPESRTPASRADAAERLLATVDRFADRRIAVAADLLADEFLYGDIARISREAPVLILEERHVVAMPGGGGNAVANLRSLGAEPVPVGVLGDDEPGERVRAALERSGVSTRDILRAGKRWRTPTKRRILAGGVHTRRQQVVRIDSGASRGDLSSSLSDRIARRLVKACARVDALLIADYDYGAATPSTTAEAASMMRQRGQTVTVDSRSRLGDYRDLTAATPNLEEIEVACGGRRLEDDDARLRAARTMLRRTGNEALLVTLGARGMALYRAGAAPTSIAAYGSDEVADVTGAGDTVIATFTLALASGADTGDAARLANYAAGLVVQKAGTATISPNELRAAIEDDEETGAGG